MGSIVKPEIMRVMISTALYWAWIFLLYWSCVLLGPVDELFWGKGAAFFGSAAALFAWFLIVRAGRDRVSENAFSRFIPYVLTPLAGIGSLINALGWTLPLPVVIALWFLSGYGAAFVLTRSARALNQLGKENSFVIICVALFIGCLVALFTTALPPASVASAVVMIVLPLAAFVLAPDYARVSNAVSAEDLAAGNGYVDESEPGSVFATKESKRSFIASWVQLFFYSVVFAFALCVGLGNNGSDLPSVFVWLGVFLAGMLIMVYGMWLNARVSIDPVQFALLGVSVVGLAMLSLGNQVPEWLRYASGALLMFGFTSYDMISLSKLLSLIAAEGLPFYRYFSLGRVANALGVFVGWLLAAVVFFATGSMRDQTAAQALPLVLMVVLVAIIMVTSYSMRLSASADREQQAAPIDSQGAWKRSCEEIGDTYGLSAREREVFALCAKGRDSAYICNALYISAHTVKSHIYHIYGKMGIHSQQELISMVEDRAEALKGGRQ